MRIRYLGYRPRMLAQLKIQLMSAKNKNCHTNVHGGRLASSRRHTTWMLCFRSGSWKEAFVLFLPTREMRISFVSPGVSASFP